MWREAKPTMRAEIEFVRSIMKVDGGSSTVIVLEGSLMMW